MNTNIRLIDTHAHIYSEELLDRIEDLRSEWIKEGVDDVLMPNIDSTSIDAMLMLESKYEECHAMMGLHPCHVKENYNEELAIVRQYLDKRSFVGVGEIGIDLYWDKTFKNQQIDAFSRQIDWALEFDLPIAIHSRDSLDLTISIVQSKQNGNLRGVFHCFNGSIEQGQAISDCGFYMGIGGVVTYKNSGVDKVVTELPIERLVLETDSPYLAPSPYRGKTNLPSYLPFICQKVADCKGMGVEEIGMITTKNAKNLFGLAPKN
jgi:TatD DNase family protein